MIASQPASSSTFDYREQFVRLGNQDKLAGLVHCPTELDTSQPFFVILNAGIVHRVGPFRLNVDIARSVAASGFGSLRFDLSGLGESEFRSGNLSAEERALLDVHEVLNDLEQRYGVNRFVTVGLCSGAFNAFQAAVADKRICGLISIDGIAFETPGFKKREFKRKLNYRFVRNAIKRRALGLNAYDENLPASQLAQEEFFEVDEDPTRLRKQLGELIDRQTHLKFIYTAGSDDFNGVEQFREMFDVEPGPRLQVDYYAESEHTFPICQHRQQLLENILDWASQNFGPTNKP